MALKIRFAWPQGAKGWLTLLLLATGVIVVAVVLTGVSVASYFYFKYGHIVDERLKQPIFANTAKVYAAPREVRPGQKLTVRLIANELREAGYTDEGTTAHRSQLGTYRGEREFHHGASGAGVVSRTGRRNDSRQQRRGAIDQRRSRARAGQL